MGMAQIFLKGHTEEGGKKGFTLHVSPFLQPQATKYGKKYSFVGEQKDSEHQTLSTKLDPNTQPISAKVISRQASRDTDSRLVHMD